jgi:iron only hydrogenase large subunit-like protein
MAVIETIAANCQDCYRCVRACPVKAIRVSDGQAVIADKLCVHCGTCVKECPQNAKVIKSSLDDVKALLVSGRAVAVSLAPSFAAAYGRVGVNLPGVLRRLGFRWVSETAEGARYTTVKSFDTRQTGNVCTACPAVNEYVEKYKPQHIKHLIPVVTPMAAHGRLLKSRYPGCAVVFIGPCAAKKDEALRPENNDAIDAVLTFDELDTWLRMEGIDIEHSVESGFDNVLEIGDARLFPLEGGMLKTGGFDGGVADINCVKISGAEAVLDLFNEKGLLHQAEFIEPLFCAGGCICGPAMPRGKSLFERRRDVVSHWEKNAREAPARELTPVSVTDKACFRDKSACTAAKYVSESEIQRVLAETGKSDPALQLNCEACGYKSCIENARAIALGMAEREMCTPFMRRLAQQRTDRIIETTPNGVVVLDGELRMLKMNPAFQRMFSCNNGLLGRRISYLIDATGFEEMQSGEKDSHEGIHNKYGIRYHERLYALRDEGQYVGIFSDISKVRFDDRQLDIIKMQTLTHAREFIDHQIRFSQEMAHYLGKSTAESEAIAKRLIALYEGEAE